MKNEDFEDEELYDDEDGVVEIERKLDYKLKELEIEQGTNKS